MLKSVRYKLHFGPYTTPRFKYGQRVEDETRGEVVFVGLSNAKIPWPTAIKERSKALAIYGGLAKAVRLEAASAVAYWWGVTTQTVTKWRRRMGTATNSTPGDKLLRQAFAKEPHFAQMQQAAWAKAQDPIRRAKIAAAKRGKARPRHVVEAMRLGRRGKPQSADTRAKMSASHKRRGTRPPAAGQAWTKREDLYCKTQPPAEAAKRTGRTLTAVNSRRSVLTHAGEKVLGFKG